MQQIFFGNPPMCAAPRHAKPVASRRPSQPTNAPQRARWVAVTGERRSANRSSWAQQHEEPNAVRWVDDEAELKPQAAVTAQGGAAGAEAAPELAAEPADEVGVARISGRDPLPPSFQSLYFIVYSYLS